MKTALVSRHRPSREVIARALQHRLGMEVVTYSYCEDLLTTSPDAGIFVVYNNFGPRKMNGIRGITEIRQQKTGAIIVGVTTKPALRKRFLAAGADAAILRAGNEISELLAALQHLIELRANVAAPAPG